MKLLVASAMLLAAVCGAVLTTVLTRSPASRRPSAVPDVEEHPAERSEAAAQRRWTVHGGGRSTAPTAANLAPGSASAARPDEPPVRESGSPAEEPAAIATGLKRRLGRETPDPTWSAEMSSRLNTDIYAAKIEHAAYVSSRCGATLCEVKVRYDADVDRNATAMALGGLSSFQAGAFYQYDEQGKESTIYVARLGKSLTAPAEN